MMRGDMAEHLKPGETYHGLRYATTDMVRVFFTNLGLDVSNWPFETRVDDNGESGFAAQEAVGNTSDGSTSGYMDGSGSAIRQIATITAWSRDDASGATSVSGSGNALPGIAREDWGHWLVRLFGDYNLNGVVDAPDYIVWRDTFGSTADLAANGNGNGRVDAPDYNVWRDFFDNRFPDPVQVPEPSSIVLLLSAAVAIGWRRRKP